MMISVFFYSRSGVVAVPFCYIGDFGSFLYLSLRAWSHCSPVKTRVFFEFGMQGVSLEQDSATLVTLFASWSWTFFVKLSLYSSLENVHSLVQDLSVTSQFTGSVSSG